MLSLGEQPKPHKGCLLISEPFLPDPNFERTVVLICEHNIDGTVGFVLNKPSTKMLPDAVDEAQNFDVPLYVGGPVQQDTLHFIHYGNLQIDDRQEVQPGIFWGGNYEQLLTAINVRKVNKDQVRFFMGYSGWSAGQLEHEIAEGSWIVHPQADINQVFHQTAELLWREVLKDKGGRYKAFSNYPTDPRLN